MSHAPLLIAYWANPGMYLDDGRHPSQALWVDVGARPQRLAHAPATGQALVSNGQLGADIIRLRAGDGFVPHTHPGDHLLVVIGGRGTLTYDGVIHPTQAGQCYLIAGDVPHAVGAVSDHALLAVGSPHKAVDDPDRMTPVAYQAVLAASGTMRCLLCHTLARYPEMLHERGCPHCPCPWCCSTGDPAEDERRRAEYDAALVAPR